MWGSCSRAADDDSSLRCVAWNIVGNISNYCSASETSETIYQMIQHNNSEDLNLQYLYVYSKLNWAMIKCKHFFKIEIFIFIYTYITEIARNSVRSAAKEYFAGLLWGGEIVLEWCLFLFWMESPLAVPPQWLDMYFKCPLSNSHQEEVRPSGLHSSEIPDPCPWVPNCSCVGPFWLASSC